MKTMVFIDEEDPDAKEQEMYIIKKLGEGFQAVVYHVGLQGTNYALKLVRKIYMR